MFESEAQAASCNPPDPTNIWLSISWDGQGGTNPADTLRPCAWTGSGTYPSPLPHTSRTDYQFRGWWTEPSGGTQITDNSAHNQSDDFTVYARWLVYITWDVRGGSAVVPDTTLSRTYDDYPDPLPTTSRTGYTFNGWYTAPSGGTQVTAGSPHNQNAHFTVYAQWAAEEFDITYLKMGGTTPSGGDSSTEYGGTISSLPTTSRTGYTFNGWYTAPSGGTRITTSSPHGQTSDFTLYAQWTANTLDITWDANGGTTPSGGDSTTTAYGTISSLATTSRTGYTFNGWYTAPSGGTKITTLSETHGQTDDFTLYAQWTANTLNITYNSNGGTTPSGGSSTTSTGGTISSLATTSRTGYTFNGWYTASSGGTRITTSSPHGRTSNFTLYAQWTANTLNITYNSNGGTTPSGGSSTTSTGGTISSLATTSRTGYTFNGWYTASSGGTRITTSSPHGRTSNFTLYAQWTANTLNITFNSNGGTTPSGGSSTTSTGGTISSLATTSRTGYTFNGWYTASSGGTRITTSSPHGRTSNFTLYAQWSINWYTYSFDPNGGGNTPAGNTKYYGQSISGMCFITSRTGYSLAGWKSSFDNVTYGSSCSSGTGRTLTGFTMPASNVVFTAQWTADTLTITYDSQSGSAIIDGDSATTTGGSITTLPTDPTRSGYTFAGWYTASSGGTQITAGAAHGQTGDFTLYAQWSLVPVYTLNYDANGGSGSPPSGATAANGVGVTVSSPSPLSRAGYTFAAWNTSSSGAGSSYASGDTLTMGAANVTLYAQWTADTLTITYDSQGGSAVSDGDRSTTTGDAIYPLPTAPTRTGYTFAGWNSAADGSGTDFGVVILPGREVAHGQTSDFTLYAQWTADTLTITYDSQSGSAIIDGDSATTTGGSITTLPTDPTRSGYTFAGWFTASSGGTQITAGAAHGQTGDFTLYAQWSLVPVANPSPPAVTSSTPETAPAIVTVAVLGHEVRHDGPESTPMASGLVAQPGTLATVGGQNFQSFSTAELWLSPTLRLLATVQVAPDGTFEFSAPIPNDIEAGEHTLHINGTNLDGRSHSAVLSLQITTASVNQPEIAPPTAAPSQPSLPTTGGAPLTSFAILIIGVGALLALRARQPHPRR